MITLNQGQVAFLTFILLSMDIFSIVIFTKLEQYRKRELHKKHFCNYCKTAYLRINELDKKQCSYCGRALTLHIEDPNFQEEAVERKNNLEPFEEFDNKGGE